MKSAQKKINFSSGFTLIEVLVFLIIISIIATIAIFGIQGAREAGRDAKRKADLANIQSGLELRRSDCSDYPSPASGRVPDPITGDGSVGCPSTNEYMNDVPVDPISTHYYSYSVTTSGGSNVDFLLCAALENPPSDSPADPSGCAGDCGAGGCNYAVQSP